MLLVPPFSFFHIGVKMKSSKTQTNQFVGDIPALQSSVSEPHFLFSPSDPAQQQQPGSPVRGYLIPMAIPLGKPLLHAYKSFTASPV